MPQPFELQMYLVTFTLIALKLCGLVTFGWWWVFALEIALLLLKGLVWVFRAL